MPGQIDLKTDNFWVKVVEMLVHNWAVVRLTRSGIPELVFFDDRSRVFDTMQFTDVDEAIAGLRRNGFEPYDQMGDFKEFLSKPKPPFGKLVRLACLAPDIVTAIVEGRQPEGLTANRLSKFELPLSWSEQRKALGFA